MYGETKEHVFEHTSRRRSKDRWPSKQEAHVNRGDIRESRERRKSLEKCRRPKEKCDGEKIN
jgi:hypothetical protein